MAQKRNTRPLLTRKKAAWVRQFKPKAPIRGNPLNYSAPAQMAYDRELQRLILEMTRTTRKELEALFNTGMARKFIKGAAMDDTISSQARILTNALMQRFEELFGKRSKPMAERMASSEEKASKTALHGSLSKMSGGLSLKTSILNKELDEVVNAVVVENVSLIRSIPQQYMVQVQGAVMRSIQNGNGLQDLVPFLANQEGVTQRRAKNIAIDQTRKAYNSINRYRMEAVGVQKFEWLHTGGSQKPRKLHQEMSGNIYSFDDLPIIDERTGERGIPGQAINCGCRMVPVISFDSPSEGAEEEEE